MTILAFDTAQQSCSVAIAREGKILASHNEAMARGHAERLVPMIEDVRRRAHVEYTDLSLIAVTIGPGTFAGVRVGLAAARAMALVHEVPVLGIGTLELLAQAAVVSQAAGTETDGVIAAIDAKRGELYAQAFNSKGTAMTAPSAGPPRPDIAGAGQISGVIVGNGAELLRVQLPKWRVDMTINQPDAAVLAQAAEAWRGRAKAEPPVPLYLRAPDAKLPQKSAVSKGVHSS